MFNNTEWTNCCDEHIFLRKRLGHHVYEIIRVTKRKGEDTCDWLHTVIFLDDYPAEVLAAATTSFGRDMEELIEFVRCSEDPDDLMDLVAMDLGETMDTQITLSEAVALEKVKKLTGFDFKEV